MRKKKTREKKTKQKTTPAYCPTFVKNNKIFQKTKLSTFFLLPESSF
jgi:hypothetical protein